MTHAYQTWMDGCAGECLRIRRIGAGAGRDRRRAERVRGTEVLNLSDIGEQVSLRQFDISDRTRDRVTAIVQWLPADSLGVNGSAAVGNETRPGAAFGLQDNDLKTFTDGVDVSPLDTVMLGTTCGFEHYTTLQRSRQANPGVQFDDPARDGSADLDERVHTATAYLDLTDLTPRNSVRELPAVCHEIQRSSIDVRHALTRTVTLGAMYLYDKYDADDFATSPATLQQSRFPGTGEPDVSVAALRRAHRVRAPHVQVVVI